MKRSILPGKRASFKVGDVVCPDQMQILRQTGPELAISGTVLYLSDSGDRKNHFAIVDVRGIHTPLIVPVNRLQSHVEQGVESSERRSSTEFSASRSTIPSNRFDLGLSNPSRGMVEERAARNQ